MKKTKTQSDFEKMLDSYAKASANNDNHNGDMNDEELYHHRRGYIFGYQSKDQTQERLKEQITEWQIKLNNLYEIILQKKDAGNHQAALIIETAANVLKSCITDAYRILKPKTK